MRFQSNAYKAKTKVGMILLIVLVYINSSNTIQSQPPSIEVILQKYLSSLGGIENVNAVKVITVSGFQVERNEVVSADTAHFFHEHRKPNLLKMILVTKKTDSTTFCLDGTHRFVKGGRFGNRYINIKTLPFSGADPDRPERGEPFLGDLFDPDIRKNLVVAPDSVIQDTDCYGLTATVYGLTYSFFISKKEGLLVVKKMVDTDQKVTMLTSYQDFIPVGALRLPRRIFHRTIGPFASRTEIHIDTYAVSTVEPGLPLCFDP